MLLKGKPVVAKLKNDIEKFINTHELGGKKVSFFLLSDDNGSQVYVWMKKRFAEKVWLVWEVIEQMDMDVETVLEMIEERNNDPDCLGMIVQLPLPKHLQEHQATILWAMRSDKDLDGLWWVQFGKTILGVGWFLPATPKAVIELLDFYGYWDMSGKNIAIFGQSNLVGKPLAVACMLRGAAVHSYNASSNQAWMREVFAMSDIVISATWVVHLVNDSFADTDASYASKVLVDVGRWIKDGKAVWDMDVPFFEQKVEAITPVPGGVWPVTVACLFHNIISLWTPWNE